MIILLVPIVFPVVQELGFDLDRIGKSDFWEGGKETFGLLALILASAKF